MARSKANEGDARARLVEAAGAFSLVLECVPADLAAEITAGLAIPTIGIGAGPRCGGQVLVYHDLLGLEERIAPRFVRRYAELGKLSREGIERFAADVRSGRFPAAEESYGGGGAARTAAGDAVQNQKHHRLDGVAVDHKERAALGIAEQRGFFHHRFEHRRQIAWRGVDHLQHFGGRSLLFQRLACLSH